MSAVLPEHKRGGLGQMASTAICGNDITSSCLYVSALAIIYSGKWAPLALLLVAAVLYLFRSVYAEVVGALPLNGGAYNALLNTTSKFRASIAACLTILSYMATAVISASAAMHYLHSIFRFLPVMAATVVLLGLFMALTMFGISESSRVAVVIFLIHLVTLGVLIVAGLMYVGRHGIGTLVANFHLPSEGGFVMAVFFGFSAAMLGITGFESSANFVEEQAEGVFPKTLRNMWIAVGVLNPTIALLALALLPVGEVAQHQESLLAHMGSLSGGRWLAMLVGIDAALVLSGAVLTSFVGVNGLVGRMTLDRCLPQFLLKTNRHGTTHRILIGFFILSLSVLLITRGDLRAMAGVYTISFLGVMALFGVGNLLLKVKRAALPRPSRAPWLGVLVAIAAVVAALIGNSVMNPPYLHVFLQYFIPSALVVTVMLERVNILRGVLFVLARTSASLARPPVMFTWVVREKIQNILDQQVVFFTRGDNAANLNRAMLYVLENEPTNRVKVVTIVKDKAHVPPKLEQELKFIDEIYPEIDIEFVAIEGTFGPELIQKLSKEWGIPPNFMFLGSPAGRLIYGMGDLGGVRLII